MRGQVTCPNYRCRSLAPPVQAETGDFLRSTGGRFGRQVHAGPPTKQQVTNILFFSLSFFFYVLNTRFDSNLSIWCDWINFFKNKFYSKWLCRRWIEFRRLNAIEFDWSEIIQKKEVGGAQRGDGSGTRRFIGRGLGVGRPAPRASPRCARVTPSSGTGPKVKKKKSYEKLSNHSHLTLIELNFKSSKNLCEFHWQKIWRFVTWCVGQISGSWIISN